MKCYCYCENGEVPKSILIGNSHIVDLRRGCLRFGAGSTNGFVSLKMWQKKQSKGKEKVGEEKAKERLSMQWCLKKRKKNKNKKHSPTTICISYYNFQLKFVIFITIILVQFQESLVEFKEICILDTSGKGNLDIHYCFFIIYICFDFKMQYIYLRTEFGYSSLQPTPNKIIDMYFKSHHLFNESYDLFK